MQRTISFICINYHCSGLIANLVQSILDQGDADFRCIVVDNTPGDPGLRIMAHHNRVHVLDAARNRGFGGGCNLGLDALENLDPQGIAWLINPDAELLPGAIATVRRCLAAADAPALLGTRIRDDAGNIWFDHGRFDRSLGRLNHEPLGPEHTLEPTPGATQPAIEPCAWVSGCSMILDLAKLPRHARFDERIFLYYEDAEFCLSLRDLGIPTFVTRDVLVSHSVSATTAKQPIRKYRHATFGKLYLLYRHAAPSATWINLLRFYGRAMIQWMHDPTQAIGRAAGATDFLCWRLQQLLVVNRGR